jgi:LacI family transcriptional regulator, galactose operon repressor
MAVTLDDVADAAGVSKSTASRVLSGSSRVSPKTRRAVLAAAERLGYRMNRIASGLRTRRSKLVGLVVTNLVNASFHAITSVVHRRLDELGYQVLLCITESDPARERRYLEALLDHRVDGLIIIGTGENTDVVKGVEATGIPVVNLIRSPDGAPGDSVMAADREGAVLATRHLLELGHRRIAFIGGPASVDSGRERYAGFTQALAEHGREPDPALVLRGPYEVPFGDEAVTRLMNGVNGGPGPRPTALYSANHEATFGVLSALVQFGVQVPGELSLVCHEEAPFFAYWHPPITFVDNGAQDMGELAAEQLLRRIQQAEAGGGGEGRSLRVGAKLVVRRSTAALPAS